MTRWLVLAALLAPAGLIGCDDNLFGPDFPIKKGTEEIDEFGQARTGVVVRERGIDQAVRVIAIRIGDVLRPEGHWHDQRRT